MKLIALTLMGFAFNWGFSQNHTIITTDYLAVKDALVAGKQNEASDASKKLLATLSKESGGFNLETKKIWDEEKTTLIKDFETIAKSNGIEAQRIAFASVSPGFWKFLKVYSSSEKLFYDYCPMKKSYWISADEKIKNPYYGSQMLTCGKVAEKIN